MMQHIIAQDVTFVAGPSLILAVLILVGVAVYQAATKNRDDERSRDALTSMIRRCGQCGQVVGAEASECRHCGATLAR